MILTYNYYFCREIGQEARGQEVPLFILIGTIPDFMIEKSEIEQIVESYMAGNNLVLTDVKTNKANNIKVFFDAPGRPVTIDDCVALSRFIEAGLDREKEDFSLMVSSSGKEK